MKKPIRRNYLGLRGAIPIHASGKDNQRDTSKATGTRRLLVFILRSLWASPLLACASYASTAGTGGGASLERLGHEERPADLQARMSDLQAQMDALSRQLAAQQAASRTTGAGLPVGVATVAASGEASSASGALTAPDTSESAAAKAPGSTSAAPKTSSTGLGASGTGVGSVAPAPAETGVSTTTPGAPVPQSVAVPAPQPATVPAPEPTAVPAPGALTSPAQRQAYASGVTVWHQIASSLDAQRALGFELDTAYVMAGLQDAYANKPLLMSRDAIDTVMATLNQQYQERAGESRARVESEGRSYRTAFAKQKGVRKDAGAWYQVVAVGSGRKLTPSDTVVVRVTGTLPDGAVFDPSGQNGQTKVVRVGALLPSVAIGLQKVGVGGQLKVVVPPEKGYGEAGLPPAIPGGATLIFDIHVERLASAS